jgi:hypothetical protein
VLLESVEQIERRLRGGERAERNRGLAGTGIELQDGGGDDAERALAADKQLPQAVAGIFCAIVILPF